MSRRLDVLVAAFETLAPDGVEALVRHYAPNAQFKDPFNEVRGAAAIARIFTHMFRQVQGPRFRVITRIEQGDEAMLTWEMHFRLARWQPEVERVIRGASYLRFDAQGRVALHRDYWDAAEELYGQLPLLGRLMRALARRLAA